MRVYHAFESKSFHNLRAHRSEFVPLITAHIMTASSTDMEYFVCSLVTGKSRHSIPTEGLFSSVPAPNCPKMLNWTDWWPLDRNVKTIS